MRVQFAQRALEIVPGAPVDLSFEVFNAHDYIDGVTARVVGLDSAWVETDPWQLSLFPDTTGTLRVRLNLPSSFPAGEHLVAVEIRSTVDDTRTEMFDLVLIVPEEPAGAIELDPVEITGGSKARFEVVCANTGNVPLDLALTAHNPEAALRFHFEPSFLAVPVGAESRVWLFVEGKRPRVGQAVTRPFVVEATDVQHEFVANGSFHQRARVPRGLITAAVLAAIVGLWAAVMIVGMGEITDDEALTKTAPLSLSGSIRDLDPEAVSASVEGQVVAGETTTGVPRVTVEAYRRTRTGTEIVASAATDEEGGYQLDGLLPGTYFFRFTAPGFVDVWFPRATSALDATPRKLRPEDAIDSLDVSIKGLPGTITGQVEAGTAQAPVTVTIRTDTGTFTTNESGAFSIGGLATPGRHQLTFEAPGYQPRTVNYELEGGQTLVANTVRMSAGPGSIAGVVTSGGRPLGGVKITAISGSTTIQTASPTTGQIGLYSLANLPTPGTYLMTFEKDGFGTQSIAIDLPAGESRTGVDVIMVGGTGTITGTVSDGTNGLGDVSVKVLGGPTAAETKSLTAAGQQGSYRIAGLETPGTYTVTFSKAGFSSVTRSVSLEASGLATGIDAILQPAVASISGTVARPDPVNENLTTPVVGATVEITDGLNARTTVSTATPVEGGYRLTGLPPGTYTITVFAPSTEPNVRVVRIVAGENAIPLLLPATSGGA